MCFWFEGSWGLYTVSCNADISKTGTLKQLNNVTKHTKLYPHCKCTHDIHVAMSVTLTKTSGLLPAYQL